MKNKSNKLIILIFFIISIISLLFFIYLASSFESTFNNIDKKVSNYTNEKSDISYFMLFITWFAEWPIILIATIIVAFLLRKHKFSSSVFVFTIILSAIVTHLLKNFYLRERPVGGFLELASFSFPSGHALVGMTFYGLVAFFSYRYLKNKKRYILATAGITMGILVGISRIFLGVHWVSDVIAGFLLSFFLIGISISVIELKEIIKNDKKN
ncbi:MAG: phosphatase PAP2 family protein [bacterium]